MHTYTYTVTVDGNRRRATVVVDPPTPNCTVPSSMTAIQATCADAVNRMGLLHDLTASASCDVARIGNFRDRVNALLTNFPCATPGSCELPRSPGHPGEPGQPGPSGRLSTWEGPRGPRGVPGR